MLLDGFLRNLSSADMGRQTMRNYPGLIDSVMTYAQNCVASNRPDDKVPAAALGCPAPQLTIATLGMPRNPFPTNTRGDWTLWLPLPFQAPVGSVGGLQVLGALGLK